MAQYSARICPENPLADAIKPIAVIIKKNDDIIFNSQMERDCFVSAAKRWVDVKILKRAKVSPHKSTCGTKTSQAPYNGNE